eukprot:jgi/Botrbrau1/7785/Bobra.0159s0213.1
MDTRAVRLSILFENPLLEQSFKTHVRSTRAVSDKLNYVVATAVYLKYYSEAKFETIAAKVFRILTAMTLLYVIAVTLALLVDHPRTRKWKPFGLPPAGILGTASVKLLSPLCYHNHIFEMDGSKWKAFVVILLTSRALSSLFTLGLWNITGGTLSSDAVYTTVLNFYIVWWNEDECKLLCATQPKMAEVYDQFDMKLGPWIDWLGIPSKPTRACVLLRVTLQVTAVIVFPLVWAYWREMSERAAFLDFLKIPYPARTFTDYFYDALICVGSMLKGFGLAAALSAAVPELERLPVILVRGWDAQTT